MTNDSTYTRRRMIQIAGGAALAGLAGCTSAGTNDGQGNSGGTDTPAGEDQNDHTDDGDDHDEDDHTETDDGHHEEDDGHHEEDKTETDDHHEEDENGHNHDEGTPQEPSPEVEVAMRTEGSQQHYDPHVAWVEPGGTVTWKLESGQHNAVAYHPDNDKPLRMPEDADPWSTGMLTEEGETESHTFETEGVYDYYCTPHEGFGMVGTVIVGHPDAHDQPALEDPQSSLPEGAGEELADLGEQTEEALGHTD